RCLAGPRAVEQPRARQAFLVRQAEPAVGHAGGADRGAGEDLGAVRQVAAHLVRQAFGAYALARQQNLGSEAADLLTRALGQLMAADAIGEAQVVLDPGAAAGRAGPAP